MRSTAYTDGGFLPDTELERLVDQYGDSLLRMCLIYLKDYALAEDAVQETFLRAYRFYGKFQGRSTEKTWLTAIAINICKDMLRSPWNRNTVGEDALQYLQSEDPALPDPAVSRAIMALPKDLRAAVVLFYIQGFKVREIADILKIPLPTVSSRLNRARAKLREALKEWYYDEE